MSEEKIKHERGYVYNFHFHLVWATKYRKQIFNTPKFVKDMSVILQTIANKNEIEIEKGEVMPDHIHLLISFKPKYAPANVVKVLKGVSAREWFKIHPETQQIVWGGHLWSPSYYMGTLGSTSKETVERYIENQRTERGKAGRPPANRN
ncbi:IS200/IS605 family transposase [Lactiplantibacillus plantarum]|uniref:IS200/IS605 family transposase n=1 Tax=Lactiplantibacillus plantarum TaxID=1590 RepID=UPI002072C64A|nr:IS200/IS605 family transposase [Lactiplantibacillus plantarum]